MKFCECPCHEGDTVIHGGASDTVVGTNEHDVELARIRKEEAIELADRIIVLGSSPGHVVADLKVDLPRPRDRRSEPFNAWTDKVFSLIEERG